MSSTDSIVSPIHVADVSGVIAEPVYVWSAIAATVACEMSRLTE